MADVHKDAIEKKQSPLHGFTPESNTVDESDFYCYDNTLEVRFLISARHAGGIIGKNGSYINKIREQAEVEFHVHRNIQASPVRTGSCRGRVRNVLAALLLMADKINELSTRGKAHVRRPSSSGTVFQFGDYQLTLLLEHKNCGVVIGKRGKRINDNRTTSGAHIKISTHPLENSSEKTIDVQGTRENVSSALDKLLVQVANDPKPSSVQRKYLDDSISSNKRNHYSSFPNNNAQNPGRPPARPQASMFQVYPNMIPHHNQYNNAPSNYVIHPTHHYPAPSRTMPQNTHQVPENGNYPHFNAHQHRPRRSPRKNKQQQQMGKKAAGKGMYAKNHTLV